MPTNKHFGEFREFMEQDLLDELTQEAIEIHGNDMYYAPRTILSTDDIFNEDLIAKFEKSYLVDFYVENAGGWEGQQDIISKLGLQINDSATLICNKNKFRQLTPFSRPREGDLVYFPVTRSLLEITFVEPEQPFYQLGEKQVFKLTVEKFKFDNEIMDTGIDDIDIIEDTYDKAPIGSSEPGSITDRQDKGEVIETEADNDLVIQDEVNPFGKW